MNPEWKAKWVQALRSGDYEQTIGMLKSASGYCCLGVLREIMEPYSEDMNDFEYLLGDVHAHTAEIGLKSQRTLATMNDNDKSFGEIADYIEKNL